jgi:hypothetical protein
MTSSASDSDADAARDGHPSRSGTRPTHGQDQLGLPRLLLDLLAQVADVNVDRARLAVVAPPRSRSSAAGAVTTPRLDAAAQ